MTQAESIQPATTPAGDPWTRATFGFLAVYFLIRAVTRAWVSSTPEMDEAEQLLHSQWLAWGYGPQPPLYTWLQIPVFSLFGHGIFALALLKNLLLFLTCVLLYRAARELSGDRRVGLVAVAALFLEPQFVWFSQSDLTHSVLASAFAAGALWVVFRLLRRQRTADYVWLGLCVAGGVLSKYSFIAFLFTLLIALWWRPEGRRLLRDARLLLAVALAVGLLAPHLWWAWSHPAESLRKFSQLRAAAGDQILLAGLTGFVAFIVTLAIYFFPAFGGCAMVLRRWPKPADMWPQGNHGPAVAILKTLLLVLIGVSLLAVLVAQATFKPRWIQPNALVLPLLIAAAWQPCLTNQLTRRFLLLAGTIALGVSMVLSGRVALASWTGQSQRQNLPLLETARHLQDRGLTPATIVADSGYVGAGVGLGWPGSLVMVPGMCPPLPARAPLLFIWEPRPGTQSLAQVTRLASQLGFPNAPFAEAKTLEVPMKFYPGKKFVANYLYLATPNPPSATP